MSIRNRFRLAMVVLALLYVGLALAPILLGLTKQRGAAPCIAAAFVGAVFAIACATIFDQQCFAAQDRLATVVTELLEMRGPLPANTNFIDDPGEMERRFGDFTIDLDRFRRGLSDHMKLLHYTAEEMEVSFKALRSSIAKTHAGEDGKAKTIVDDMKASVRGMTEGVLEDLLSLVAITASTERSQKGTERIEEMAKRVNSALTEHREAIEEATVRLGENCGELSSVAVSLEALTIMSNACVEQVEAMTRQQELLFGK